MIFQNFKKNNPILRRNVGMPYFGVEFDLWWFVGEFRWYYDIELEDPSIVTCPALFIYDIDTGPFTYDFQ